MKLVVAITALFAAAVHAQEYDVLAYLGTDCNGANLGGVEGDGGVSNCEPVINAQSLLLDTLSTGCTAFTFQTDATCTLAANHFYEGGSATGCQKNLDFSYILVDCDN
ncbi:hypothetical protein BDW22DRAFT_1350277 [Trametopsis cervina]|nr:hypothetical protein BDW22DRAFT_1350277 [Trametopsis cervina]